jgi:CRISPR-associated endonuclease/helicase Cas3
MAEHLAELGGEVWATTAARCAMTAIARHHGTRTRECTLFRFEGDAARECAARAAAAERDFDLQACRSLVESGAFPDELLAFSRETDFDSWPLFVFLVRRLRLADHRATAGR